MDGVPGLVEEEARVAEITRDSMETAFRLDIYGKKTCADGETCARGTGWLMYSVERFYEGPLVYDVTCDGHDVTFGVANAFKQASQYEGFFNITDDKDAELATGRFSFAPHWRATCAVEARSITFVGSAAVHA